MNWLILRNNWLKFKISGKSTDLKGVYGIIQITTFKWLDFETVGF